MCCRGRPDDTDIAVMLLYHCSKEMDRIYFVQQRTTQAWNLQAAELKIQDIKDDLLL